MDNFFNAFGSHFFDGEEFLTLLLRFLLNGVFAYILIDRIYYRINKQKEYLFTFFILNILIFFVSSLLSDAKIKTGFAFGLFAIFSILRYRTEQMNIKEMTFLFTSIILAVINSMVTIKTPLANILFANVIIITAAYFLERRWLKSFSHCIPMIYENIELINIERRDEFIADVEARTGVKVKTFEINKIDYLKDVADITVYYE